MDREELLEQLEPISHTQVRQVEHRPRTRVVVTPDMVVLRPGGSGRLIPMSNDGVKAMANFVGMPHSLGQRLSADTFGRVATELLARKERYNLLINQDRITDFADYRGVRMIHPERLVATIERAIPGADFHRVTMLPNYSTMIEVVGDQRQPVRRGDMIRAGAMVTFSPIGTIHPLVQSYVMRLACTNGATDNTILREFQGGGEGDDIWQWFRQSLRDSYQSLRVVVNRYREMLGERISADQRVMMLEALLREARITGGDAEAVRARAMQQPPRSTYDLLNIMTWASSHVIREPQRIQRTLATAATFTADQEHTQICPLCHSHR